MLPKKNGGTKTRMKKAMDNKEMQCLQKRK